MKRKFLRLVAGVVAAGVVILSAFTVGAQSKPIYAMDDAELEAFIKSKPELAGMLEGKSEEQIKNIIGAMDEVLLREQAFDDVTPEMWHYPYVMTLYNKGGVSGIGNGCFDPDADVTAAEFFAIAARLVMPDKIDMSSSEECWAFPYYDAMVAEGMIRAPHKYYSEWPRSMEDFVYREEIPDRDGYVFAGPAEYHHYGMGRPLSRNDMAMLLVRLARYRGERIGKLEGIENNIDDSAECKEEVFEAYSAGLVTGKGDGNFDPYGRMTRAELCVVFCRLMNYIPREEVVAQAQKHSDYIVTAAGPMKGKIKPEVARKYNLEALSKMYVKEDENGVYLTITVPELPEELADCTFSYYVSGVNSLDNYFFDDPEFMRYQLKPGETHTGHLIHYDTEGPVRSSEIAYMEFGVKIQIPDYGYTLYHQADTTSKELVLESWYDDRYEAIAADVSHIFAGIGK